jgi:Cu(I)/Ag(I) efflux system membrane fusion protein
MNNPNALAKFVARNKFATTMFAVVLILAAAGAWIYKRHGGMFAPTSAKQERKVLYWHDPMVPGTRFDKPGKSPFMDMQLVPVYADEAGANSNAGVTIIGRTLQNMGVRTAQVTLDSFAPVFDVVGIVKPDERRIEVVQSRAAGWIERMPVRAINDPVQQGQVVAEIYSPDIVAAQEEYLLVKRSAQAGERGEQLLYAVRARLQLLGVSAEQIDELDRSGQAQHRVALRASATGLISELNVRQGAFVPAGGTIMTLTDLSTVWVIAEVPENQIGGVKPDTDAEIYFAALPGKTFAGKVESLYPNVTSASRTLKVRLVIDNAGGELRPDMFATVTLHTPEEAKVLVVPSEAVIATGKRNVVIVAEGSGKFMPVDVIVGRERDGKTEILNGVTEGQTVVSSGQFLIDSESSLRSTLKRFEAAPAAPSALMK